MTDLREALEAAGLPSVVAPFLSYTRNGIESRLDQMEHDAEAIARVMVRENLKRLAFVDFGGLVACGTNRQQAEALILSLLFPEAAHGR